MAFSKQQREGLISQIVTNSAFSKDQLESLTDNQLVALNSPVQLDLLVNGSYVDKKMTKNEDMNKKMVENEDMESEDEMEEDSMDSEESDMEGSSSESGMKKPAPPKNPVEAKVNKTAEQTTNQWLRNAPPEIRRMVANARAIELQQREQLISTITANSSCPFSEDELQARTTEDLQAFAKMASISVNRQDFGGFDYSGAAGAFSVNSQSKVEPLGLPTADYMKQ